MQEENTMTSKKTLRLGPLRIDNPFIQAPLAGWTDAPFRTIARKFHKGLMFTEMVSAEALCRGNERTLEYCRIEKEHHPIALQLVGHDTDRMAQAAVLAQDFEPDIIDINAGCPHLKVVNKGAGGALLKDTDKLAVMVSKIARAVNVPVSVKLRLGYEEDESIRIGNLLEEAGATFLTFNCDTVLQGYESEDGLNALRDVVEQVDLPVIANGGARNEEEAIRMLEHTKAAGVMLGRSTRGRPDRPATCRSLLRNGVFRRMDTKELFQTIKEHAMLECEMYGEVPGMKRVRKHLHWYMKSASLLNDSRRIDSMHSLLELDAFLEHLIDGN